MVAPLWMPANHSEDKAPSWTCDANEILLSIDQISQDARCGWVRPIKVSRMYGIKAQTLSRAEMGPHRRKASVPWKTASNKIVTPKKCQKRRS